MRWRSAIGFPVPVGRFAAPPVHGIEADVLRRGNLGPQARRHGLPLARENLLDFRFHSSECGCTPLAAQARVDLGRGFVEAQLDHREIRRSRFQIVREAQTRQLALRLVQFLEIAPEVHEQQVAFMSQQRIDGALAAVGGPASMAASACAASSRIAARSAAGAARQAGRRKRIIWCSTLAPSSVSGTAGGAVSASVSGVMLFYYMDAGGGLKDSAPGSSGPETPRPPKLRPPGRRPPAIRQSAGP